MALQFQWTPPVSLLQVETKLSASPPSEETTSLERGGEGSERPKNSNGKKGDQREREKLKRKEWDILPKNTVTLENPGIQQWREGREVVMLPVPRPSESMQGLWVGSVWNKLLLYPQMHAHTHRPLWIGMVWWCMLIFDWSAAFIPTCPGGSE